MNNSLFTPTTQRRLKPRRKPSQGRSENTVEAILDGAAHILERLGIDGYTTNAIATRAGVSIGSLYQYFPTKDAVTVALIERELGGLVQEATQALRYGDARTALRQAIEIGVRYRTRRPILTSALDIEQRRLSALMPDSVNAMAMHGTMVEFLSRAAPPGNFPVKLVASDLLAMISSLTKAPPRREPCDPSKLVDRVEGVVLGYLGATLKNRLSVD